MKRYSVFSCALLLLLGSNMATAKQNGKNTEPNLCKYTEVDYKGRPPFKRRTVTRECTEQSNPAHVEKVLTATSDKQNQNHGHPSTRKR